MVAAKLDVNRLARDIANLEEPTSAALRGTLEAIATERAGLQRLREHIEGRMASLEEMEATVRSVAPGAPARASRSTTKTTARKKSATRKRASKKATKQRTSRRTSEPLGNIIERELAAAGTELTIEQLKDRVEETIGSPMDRRGLAGALNGGTRSGRFVKTESGAFRLSQPETAG